MRPLARRFAALTAAIVSAVALTTPIAPDAGAAPASPASPATLPPAPLLDGDQVGVSFGYTILWESPEDQARDLDAVAATGAKWVRIDFFWNSLQPTPDYWNWSYWDSLIGMAQDRGLEVLGIPMYSASWARPPGHSGTYPPDDLGLWSDFIAAIVSRYAPRGVHAWEIWNEPNIRGFWETPDPVAYTELLRASYTTIKAIDPTATVVTGGLSPASDAPDQTMINPVTFVAGMYAAGAQGYFDAIAVHPYSFPWHPTDPATEDWNTFLRVPLVRDLMVANGDGGKKIWLTEYGAPTGTSETWAVSEEEQGEFVTEGFAAIAEWSYAGPVFWYSHRDRGTNLEDREDNFGLLRIDFTPKPAYGVFDAAVGGDDPAPPPTIPPDYSSRVAPIARLYRAYFQRVPDYPGLMYWVADLDGGASLPSISAFFAASPEFANLYGDFGDSGFVDLVYENVLGREPDATGRGYWLDRLRDGSIDRAGLMVGFSESSEFVRDQTNEVAVITAFGWMLHEVPSAAEFDLWVSRLDAGTPLTDLLLALQ